MTMYSLNYYLESNPGVLYPSFVQAACARRGDDVIHVHHNPGGHFLREFDTVDDLIGDILANAHRTTRCQCFFCESGQANISIFDCNTCDAPIQWILDNAYRFHLEGIQAVSTPNGCRYILDGLWCENLSSDWSLDLRITYLQ